MSLGFGLDKMDVEAALEKRANEIINATSKLPDSDMQKAIRAWIATEFLALAQELKKPTVTMCGPDGCS